MATEVSATGDGEATRAGDTAVQVTQRDRKTTSGYSQGVLKIGRGLAVGLAAITALTVVGAPAQSAERVPVPNGRYGDVFGTEGISFKVRGRKIVDPRVSLWVECTHNDGTTSEVPFGWTGSDTDRRFRVPRNGNGHFSWFQEWDNSLIEDATVTVRYTFRANRPTLASVHVVADRSEVTDDGGLWTSHCEGYTPFRVRRGPLDPTGR